MVKTNTNAERLLRRSKRLQKKLHVDQFRAQFCQFRVTFDDTSKSSDDRHDEIADMLYETCNGGGFCFTGSKTVISGGFDYRIGSDAHVLVANKLKLMQGTTKVEVSLPIDAWYAPEFDEIQDLDDLLLRPGTIVK